MPRITTAIEEEWLSTLLPTDEAEDKDGSDEAEERDKAEETEDPTDDFPPQPNKVPRSKTVKKYFLFINSSYQKIN